MNQIQCNISSVIDVYLNVLKFRFFILSLMLAVMIASVYTGRCENINVNESEQLSENVHQEAEITDNIKFSSQATETEVYIAIGLQLSASYKNKILKPPRILLTQHSFS